jgi:hypothetical protein
MTDESWIAHSEMNSENTQEVPSLPSETVTQARFLARSWLDQFEKESFSGKTLTELLSSSSNEQSS